MKTLDPPAMLRFNFPGPRADVSPEKIPRAFLTLAGMPSMRFRRHETNLPRNRFFADFCPDRQVVPMELVHSREVFAVNSLPAGPVGDGIITVNPCLVPVITVADCMPIYLWEPSVFCFGVLHSGWRGTGIVLRAFDLGAEEYGANPRNFRVILGPHIQACCYTVEEDRAAYFARTFTPECVEKAGDGQWHLSLAKANIALLKQAGVPPEHILCCPDCTCCDERFGSFRRQTAGLPDDMPLEEKSRHFTAMAAFAAFLPEV
jgi:YfiH family protein